MKKTKEKNSIIIWILSFIAFGFGVMTVKSGGFALFGGEAGKQFAGNYIPLVLWFNFFAGFFYIVSGIGIFFRKTWSVDLAIIITLLTGIIFAIFGIIIFFGGIYEVRTLGAMTFRIIIWTVISIYSAKIIGGNRFLFFKRSI